MEPDGRREGREIRIFLRRKKGLPSPPSLSFSIFHRGNHFVPAHNCFVLFQEEEDSPDAGADDPPPGARERLLKSTDVERMAAAEDDVAAADSYAYNIKGLHPQTRYLGLIYINSCVGIKCKGFAHLNFRYRVRLQAQNEAGWSPVSDDFEFVTSHIGEEEPTKRRLINNSPTHHHHTTKLN